MGSLGRVLVTGAGGALGQSLLAALDGDDVVGLGHAGLDVADREAVLQAFGQVVPDVGSGRGSFVFSGHGFGLWFAILSSSMLIRGP